MSWWLSVKSEVLKWVVILTCGVVVGLTMGWRLWSPKPAAPKHEAAAPAIIQNDKSTVLARRATQPPTVSRVLPRGATAEREIHVEAIPDVQGLTTTSPFVLDLTLVKMPDETHRVIVSSPNGAITAQSFDVPTAYISTPDATRYAVGAVYGRSLHGKSVGAFIDRDIAWLRIGLEITRNTSELINKIEWEGRVKLGIKL